MFEKFEILIIIFVFLLIFYLVISFASGGKRKSKQSPEIASYMFGVRVLIVFIGFVSLILWSFL